MKLTLLALAASLTLAGCATVAESMCELPWVSCFEPDAYVPAPVNTPAPTPQGTDFRQWQIIPR